MNKEEIHRNPPSLISVRIYTGVEKTNNFHIKEEIIVSDRIKLKEKLMIYENLSSEHDLYLHISNHSSCHDMKMAFASWTSQYSSWIEQHGAPSSLRVHWKLIVTGQPELIRCPCSSR